MSTELENALATIMRPDFARAIAPPGSRPARPNPKAVLADYLARVFPSRGHGATDCGEYMADGGALSDADHMIQWLAERGIAVVDTKGRR